MSQTANLQEVTRLFAKIADMEYDDAVKWQFLCKSAISSIASMLKSGCDISSNGDRICSAAAVLAYRRYVIQKTAQGDSCGYKVGDITVNSTDSAVLNASAQMWEDAKKDIKDLITDDSFVFGRIT